MRRLTRRSQSATRGQHDARAALRLPGSLLRRGPPLDVPASRGSIDDSSSTETRSGHRGAYFWGRIVAKLALLLQQWRRVY